MLFLTSVVRVERHQQLFRSDETLKQFCEKIVLPNMTLRGVLSVMILVFGHDLHYVRLSHPSYSNNIESDEELFEDDPIEYIRRDLEGSGKPIMVF